MTALRTTNAMNADRPRRTAESRPIDGPPAKSLPPGLAWRVPLGVGAAIVSPGLLIAVLVLIEALARLGGSVPIEDFMGTDSVMKFFLELASVVASTLIVTVPAAIVFGFPLIAWFVRSQWFQWWSHALAGLAVGLICGILAVGPLAIGVLIFAGFGAFATSACWLVALGGRRAWLVAGGLLAVLLLALSVVRLVL